MNFNHTPTDRVNKYISNNIKLTYKCHTFLETSGQDQPLYSHIGLIIGCNLTPHIYRVNKLMTNNLILNSQNKSDLDETFTEPSDGHCLKPDQIKLYQL